MKYYIISGEASGDLHGSNLIHELKKLDPDAEIRGWGGDRMKEKGADIVRHYKEHNYMGFIEVIIHLRKILANIHFCRKDITEFKPDTLILIDFPGFNLRIAKWARLNNFRVIYYISPQVWAWKSSRVKTIRRYVDKMITILPFEKQFYSTYNVDAEYVGHPLLDAIPEKTKQTDNKKNQITLLPGSRKQEIKRMLPIMTSATSFFPEYEFVIAGVSDVETEFYKKHTKREIPVVYNKLYDLLEQSKATIVTSGTATLETALNNIPLVVCYKSNYISYFIARTLIKVKFISLVNLILDKPVVCELIQRQLTTERLQSELKKLMYSEQTRNAIFADYEKLRELLGNKGASARAASIIHEYLKKSNKNE